MPNYLAFNDKVRLRPVSDLQMGEQQTHGINLIFKYTIKGLSVGKSLAN